VEGIPLSDPGGGWGGSLGTAALDDVPEEAVPGLDALRENRFDGDPAYMWAPLEQYVQSQQHLAQAEHRA
jgi:hypothetical protein